MALTGTVNHASMRRKSTGLRVLRNKQRYAGRRAILDGFPVEPHPFSLDEVRAYFSGDVIQCLLCGKKYRMLGVHLKRVHEVWADDYKAMYGLSWRRGLTSEDCHRVIGDVVLKRLEERGNPSHAITPEEQKTKQRPMTLANKQMNSLKIKMFNASKKQPASLAKCPS